MGGNNGIFLNFQNYVSTAQIQQALKFAVVGVTNFMVSFIIYYLIFNYAKLSVFLANEAGEWGISELNALHRVGIKSLDGTIANTFGYTAGVINSFILNKKWTFNVTHKSSNQFQKFFLYNLLCIGLSNTGIFIFVDIMSLPYHITWFSVNIVITIFTFFYYKLRIFKHQTEEHGS